MKLIVKIIVVIFAIVLIGFIGFTGFIIERLNASKPDETGTLQVEGLSAPVNIVRDENGIAHIFGETDLDVFYALGFVHASERYFQMDLMRRYVRGRLSEVFGPDTVRVDARTRTLGYAKLADEMASTLSPQTRVTLEAYTAGVNQRLAQRKPVAPEYLILRKTPQAWSLVDSVAVMISFANDLAAGGSFDRDKALLSSVLSPEQLEQFMTGFPDWSPTTLKDEDIRAVQNGVKTQSLAPPPQARPDNIPGSNAWVISGERSETGRPLLANDPHLGLSTPSIWYYARLNLSYGPVIGATAPGIPYVILGRNAHGAWGFTNTGFDVVDYIQRDPQSVDISERTEIITVAGAADTILTIQTTPEGLVLNPDWFDLSAFDPDQLTVYRSTTNLPGNQGVDVAAAIMASTDFSSFVEATRGYTVPMQNMHYAGIDGTIGYTTAGLLPIRDPQTGDWTGFVPFEELPRVVNPKDGLIASGNNLVASAAYPYPLPGSYSVYRAPRIEQVLNSYDQHNLETFKALQNDVTSTQIERIMPVLLGAEPETQIGAEALAKLENWDVSLDMDGPEGLIISSWLRVLAASIWADELGTLASQYNQPRRAFLELVLLGEGASWCDDVRTDGLESCAITAGLALDAAMEETARRYGRNIDNWNWGEAHQAVFNHPLGDVPIIGKIFKNKIPTPGDGSTINMAHFSYSSGNYDAFHAASMRAIYDLADLNRSLYMFAPGQSGHPLSDHHSDQLEPWSLGDYFEIRDDWDVQSIPDTAKNLVLEP